MPTHVKIPRSDASGVEGSDGGVNSEERKEDRPSMVAHPPPPPTRLRPSSAAPKETSGSSQRQILVRPGSAAPAGKHSPQWHHTNSPS